MKAYCHPYVLVEYEGITTLRWLNIENPSQFFTLTLPRQPVTGPQCSKPCALRHWNYQVNTPATLVSRCQYGSFLLQTPGKGKKFHAWVTLAPRLPPTRHLHYVMGKSFVCYKDIPQNKIVIFSHL